MLLKSESIFRNVQEINTSRIERFASLLIALSPILSPYSFHGVSITLAMSGIMIIWHFLNHGLMIPIRKEYRSLIIYALMTFMLSINGLFILNEINNLMNSLIMLIVNIITYIIAWEHASLKQTIKYANVAGYICCAYVVYQFIMMITGNVVPLGKLPIFNITTGWVPDIWGFRFNSLFSEPSYFAIYLIPLFTYHFINSNWKNAIIFGIFIVMSSSSLGIISMMVVIAWQLIFGYYRGTRKIKYIVITLISLMVGYYFLTKIPSLSVMFGRTTNKIFDIWNSAGDNMRMSGYLEYYEILPLKEQLLGVGIAQLRNYFLQYGHNLSNYSNSFVLALINTGAIGFLALMYYLFNVCVRSMRSKSFPFFLLVVLVMASDSVLLGYRFYWLIYFVYAFNTVKREED